jgi:hypothetical protein
LSHLRDTRNALTALPTLPSPDLQRAYNAVAAYKYGYDLPGPAFPPINTANPHYQSGYNKALGDVLDILIDVSGEEYLFEPLPDQPPATNTYSGDKRMLLAQIIAIECGDTSDQDLAEGVREMFSPAGTGYDFAWVHDIIMVRELPNEEYDAIYPEESDDHS